MIHGTYIGKVHSLKGKGALLRVDKRPGIPGWLAQFDEPLTLGDPPLQKRLDIGWHEFPAGDFRVEYEPRSEDVIEWQP